MLRDLTFLRNSFDINKMDCFTFLKIGSASIGCEQHYDMASKAHRTEKKLIKVPDQVGQASKTKINNSQALITQREM